MGDGLWTMGLAGDGGDRRAARLRPGLQVRDDVAVASVPSSPIAYGLWPCYAATLRLVFCSCGAVGVSLDQVTEQLLKEGVASFQRSFDTLLAGLSRKTASLVAS